MFRRRFESHQAYRDQALSVQTLEQAVCSDAGCKNQVNLVRLVNLEVKICASYVDGAMSSDVCADLAAAFVKILLPVNSRVFLDEIHSLIFKRGHARFQGPVMAKDPALVGKPCYLHGVSCSRVRASNQVVVGVARFNKLLNHVGSGTNVHVAQVLFGMRDILHVQIYWAVVVWGLLWLCERVCLHLAG